MSELDLGNLAEEIESLGRSDRRALESRLKVLVVVSAWEIQIKHQINRLQLEVPLEEMIQGQQAINNLRILPVKLHHVYTLQQLPLHHHDPFDRLLIAQARAEQMRLVSADGQFAPYPVEIIW